MRRVPLQRPARARVTSSMQPAAGAGATSPSAPVDEPEPEPKPEPGAHGTVGCVPEPAPKPELQVTSSTAAGPAMVLPLVRTWSFWMLIIVQRVRVPVAMRLQYQEQQPVLK